MRQIERIVIHCTATDRDTTTVEAIQKYWRKELGWQSPGYHHIWEPDGTRHDLAGIYDVVNGARGFNQNAIHLAYIGGEHEDDMTDRQHIGMVEKIRQYTKLFPHAEVLGHRDLPGVAKDCPRFDVKEKFKYVIIRRDPIVDDVRNDLFERSKKGLKKYGIGLHRDDLTLREWLQHLYEEQLDAALYTKRAILELDDQDEE